MKVGKPTFIMASLNLHGSSRFFSFENAIYRISILLA